VLLMVLAASVLAIAVASADADADGAAKQGEASAKGITVSYIDSMLSGYGLMTVDIDEPDDDTYTLTIDGRMSAPVSVSQGPVAVTELSVGSHTVKVECGSQTWTLILRLYVPVTGITVEPASKTLQVGESFDITATVKPAEADQRVVWTVEGDSVTVDNGKVTAVKSGTSKVTASSASDPGWYATCTVTVEKQTFTITATAGDGGRITPSGEVKVTEGTNKTFNIQPNQGYTVSELLVDGEKVAARTSYSFRNVTADHTISASFAPVPYHTITATAGEGGSITPSGEVSVQDGANQRFSIMPASGYSVKDVKVDGRSVGPVYTHTFSNVTADHTIAAEFQAASTITVTIAATGNGTVSQGSVSVTSGTSFDTQDYVLRFSDGQEVTAIPGDGSGFQGWEPSAGVVESAMTITAVFDDAPVTDAEIHVDYDDGRGTVTYQQFVQKGSDTKVSFRANDDYYLAGITVDGEAVAVQPSITLKDVQDDVYISVDFQYSEGARTVIGPDGTVTETYTYTDSQGNAVSVEKITRPDGSVKVTESHTETIDGVDHRIVKSSETAADGSWTASVTDTYTKDGVTYTHESASSSDGSWSDTLSYTENVGGRDVDVAEIRDSEGNDYTIATSEGDGYTVISINGKHDGESVSQDIVTFDGPVSSIDAAKFVEAARMAEALAERTGFAGTPTVVVVANGDSVTLGVRSLAAKVNVAISFDSGAVVIPADVFASMARSGEAVRIVLEKVDVGKSDMSDEQKAIAKKYDTYRVLAYAGNTLITEFSGPIEVSVDYTLKSGETASKVKMYYLSDDASVTAQTSSYVPGESSGKGTLDASITRSAYYFATGSYVAPEPPGPTPEPSGDNTTLYIIAGIAIAIIAIAAIAFFVMKRRR